MNKKSILIVTLLFLSVFCKADDHWGTVPPLPKINVEHDQYSGIATVGWISDSTFDRPIWYLIEVKQVSPDGVIDPNWEWYRPLPPIRSNFNEYVTVRMQYKDSNGVINSWVNAEMLRVVAMWGA